MRGVKPIVSIAAGIAIGTVFCLNFLSFPRPVLAANDRHDNYVLCTGMAGVNPRSPMDGVWLLDYKQGKLLATLIDRTIGKIVGFSELDLVTEFGLAANQNVNFLMTTGTITPGQSALYLVETMTGKFGVYSMGPTTAGQSGVTILRHDLTTFRKTGN